MDVIKEAVQQKYGEAALQARSGAKAGCGCGTACGTDPITSNLYDEAQAVGIPAEALLASLLAHVDEVAEIPRAVRAGATVVRDG